MDPKKHRRDRNEYMREYRKRPEARKYRREYASQWKAKNKDKVKVYNRRNRLGSYGLSVSEFNSLLQAQGGRCAICGTSEPGQSGAFHVDHDHHTGKVRGLLCSGCNRGIGFLKDDLLVLESAVEYLKKFQTVR